MQTRNANDVRRSDYKDVVNIFLLFCYGKFVLSRIARFNQSIPSYFLASSRSFASAIISSAIFFGQGM